jgi:hypothetical protein
MLQISAIRRLITQVASIRLAAKAITLPIFSVNARVLV